MDDFAAEPRLLHWLAADAKGSRVVLAGDDQGYVLAVDVDPRTGALVAELVPESFCAL